MPIENVALLAAAIESYAPRAWYLRLAIKEYSGEAGVPENSVAFFGVAGLTSQSGGRLWTHPINVVISYKDAIVGIYMAVLKPPQGSGAFRGFVI